MVYIYSDNRLLARLAREVPSPRWDPTDLMRQIEWRRSSVENNELMAMALRRELDERKPKQERRI